MAQEPLMNACRICLMENSIMIPIFGEDGFYRKVREMVKDAFNIVLNQGDPLPRKICCKCYFKLQQTCQLKVDFVRSTRTYIHNAKSQRSPESMRLLKVLNGNLSMLTGNVTVAEMQSDITNKQVPQARTSFQSSMQMIRATLLIDTEEESTTGSNYLCELCDTKFISKQAIAIHKHRKHGLQLLIEANSLPHSSFSVNNNEKIASAPKSKPTPKVKTPIKKITPSITVADVSDDNDDKGADFGGDASSPPPSPMPMEFEENKPSTPEPVAKSSAVKKPERKKAAASMRNSLSPGVAKKSTGGFVNTKTKRKSALKAERELKKLETNSNMRISEDEMEELASRKRPRSRSTTSRSSSTSYGELLTPRKAAVNAEKKIKSTTKREERNSMSDPEDEPKPKRKCEVEEPDMKPQVNLTPMNKISPAASASPFDPDLLDDKGRLECLFCFKIIHNGRYYAHMRKFHSNVDEFSWQIKPGQVEETQTPSKEVQQVDVTKVKTEVNRDLSSTMDIAERESFLCNICDKTFNKRIALIQHTKKVHKMNYCCGEAFEDDAFMDHNVLHDLDSIDDSVEVDNADNREETEAALAVFSAPLPPKAAKENVKPTENAKPNEDPQPAASVTNRGRRPKSRLIENVDRVFNCTKCIFKGTENEVYDHYSRIHRLRWCFTCKLTFSKIGLLETHFNEQHFAEYKEILDFYDRGDSDVTEWTCKSCKKPFKNKSRLLQHYKMKHSLLPCFICTAAFKTQEQLQQHADVCEKKTCSYCSERFAHKISFLLHELQHVDDEDIDDFRPHKNDFYNFIMENSNFRCTSCKLAFSSEQLYQRHLQKIHKDSDVKDEDGKKANSDSKAVTCNACDKMFASPKYLKMHKCSAGEQDESDAEEEKNPGEFKCEICRQCFLTQIALRNHLEVHALNDDD